ncbi:hypothetical protein CASFOL_029338 [Castilleja foliolosa]|uniref:Uncharacterized protein n=1 Tax=Castilleja foliolosa TaxID=1961234 RepID=A0ABD3CAE1_9LAMI
MIELTVSYEVPQLLTPVASLDVKWIGKVSKVCKEIFTDGKHTGGCDATNNVHNNQGNLVTLFTEGLISLPPYEGKSVLELGADIGRFTDELDKKANKEGVFVMSGQETRQARRLDLALSCNR